ncbi:hypothetical protein ACFVQ3_09540 [Oerskovia sp. NPDC057915]|uniref:hypothetical protein n=1 Tax=Oerskovia sp. NPDC057915 TaxID=3346280 RepID=UPI0036D8B8E8
MTHHDETGGVLPQPQGDARETSAETATGAGDAARRPDARRVPRIDALVPGALRERGRAALAGVESARANVETAGASVRGLGRRLRAPGALFGPPAPAVGVPAAPEHPLHRSQAEVAALLPRSFEVAVAEARGDVGQRGWTGRVFLVGESSPGCLVRRSPRAPLRGGEIASGLLDLAVEGLVGQHAGSSDDPHTVELLDPDGHVLLRSTPVDRRRDDRTVREVSLADGTPVAAVVAGARKDHHREVVPRGALRAAPVLTDLLDLYPGRESAARVWRGPEELASIRTEDRQRMLTVRDLTADDEALLVWAAALCWWGAGT